MHRPEHLLLETMWGGRGVVRQGFLACVLAPLTSDGGDLDQGPSSTQLSRQVHRIKLKHKD
jgi:hypothetical protein